MKQVIYTFILITIASMTIFTKDFFLSKKTIKDSRKNSSLTRDTTSSVNDLIIKKATNRQDFPIVAIVDTGVDTQHPWIAKNLWQNAGEIGLDINGHDKQTNQIDDDGNGYIDDVHGWNFANSDSDLADNNGHGTHIAGIIANKARPQVQMMILKIYDEHSKISPLAATAKAIAYATKMGAQVINYSGGGLTPDFDEKNSLIQAAAKNILVIAAAGNEGAKLDSVPFYPASYNLSNIVSVAAINRYHQLMNASNYSETKVDIAGLGHDVLSALPSHLQGQTTGKMSGTSQATAMITALATHLWSPNIPARTWKALILQNSQTDLQLIHKTRFASKWVFP